MSASHFVFSESVNARGRANVAVCESELEKKKECGWEKEVFLLRTKQQGHFFMLWQQQQSK